MPHANNNERKSAQYIIFSHYLRTGEKLTLEEWLMRDERKFNPYHDPENGQFTFGPNSAGLTGERGRSIQNLGRKTPPMSQKKIEAHAINAMKLYNTELSRGMSPEEAAAWAANSEAESGGDPTKHQKPGGPGRGLFQWGSTNPAYDRRITFQKVMGIPIDLATAQQQLNFRDWELNNTYKSAKIHISAAITVMEKARAITKYYLAPADTVGASEDRARIAEVIYRKAKMR